MVTSVIVLYLNTFILIVQLFEKVPALKELAPTQSELPFKVVQILTLLAFTLLGTLAAKGFSGTGPIALKHHASDSAVAYLVRRNNSRTLIHIPKQQRSVGHGNDHDERRNTDLLQGLGHGTADRFLSRLAADSGRLGRADAVLRRSMAIA